MKDTHIVGKTVAIGQPAHILYGAFSDMRNFVERLPEDKKEGIKATQDSIEGTVKGITLGAKVMERVPFSLIRITDFSESGAPSLFPFEIALHFDVRDEQTTDFHMELNAELSFMLKVMIGGKLQDAIDKITEQLAMAAEGKMPLSDCSL